MKNYGHKLNILKLTFYILSISLTSFIFLIFSSIVDPSLTLSSNYCQDFDVTDIVSDRFIGDEEVIGCIKFSSFLDEQIYNYNTGVSNRKVFWLIPTVVIMIIVSRLLLPIFYSNKEERDSVFGHRDRYEKWGTIIATIFFAILGTVFLTFILPKPADYMPFITYQLDKWEKETKNKIMRGVIYITNDGKVIKK